MSLETSAGRNDIVGLQWWEKSDRFGQNLKLVTKKLAVRDPKSFSCNQNKKRFVLCFDLFFAII